MSVPEAMLSVPGFYPQPQGEVEQAGIMECIRFPGHPPVGVLVRFLKIRRKRKTACFGFVEWQVTFFRTNPRRFIGFLEILVRMEAFWRRWEKG